MISIFPAAENCEISLIHYICDFTVTALLWDVHSRNTHLLKEQMLLKLRVMLSLELL